MPDVPDRSYCRHPDCRAPILWVRTTRGRLMPLDAEPVPFGRGVMIFAENNVVRAAKKGESGPFFMSHHATCQYADAFRSHVRKKIRERWESDFNDKYGK